MPSPGSIVYQQFKATWTCFQITCLDEKVDFGMILSSYGMIRFCCAVLQSVLMLADMTLQQVCLRFAVNHTGCKICILLMLS